MPTDRNLPRARTTTVRDAGLQAFFQRIYQNLALGLTFTGVVAWMVASSPALLHFFFGNFIMILVVLFAPMFVISIAFSPRRIATMTSGQMAAAFYGISAIFGISFAIIFLAYSGESIARVFFITAGTFAGTSAIGYSSKRDLSGVGAFGMMGMWGIFLAFLVNMFMHSPMVMYVSSMIGVIACVCLIAWNTQMFKEMYNHAADRESNQKLAILAALNLYMSFINLFQFLLNLMGNRR
ncbi:MAG TPA: Bax inhibitor-1/YccA family protein [Patescibacteria group bacterium]|jgi:hypothetical protein|nr:Bax inhibitor-1/YccA family protein [Patescibacteria group bacterium]